MPRFLRRLQGQRRRVRGTLSRCRAFESLESRLALTTFTVNRLADGRVNIHDNAVTLRDAISAANVDSANQFSD